MDQQQFLNASQIIRQDIGKADKVSVRVFGILVLLFSFALAGCGGGGGSGSSDDPPPMNQAPTPVTPPSSAQGSGGGGGIPTSSAGGGGGTSAPPTSTSIPAQQTQQQVVQNDVPQDLTPPGQRGEEGSSQQAEVVFDGTIPMRDVFLNLHEAVRIDIDSHPPRFDLTLTVGGDGGLTFDSGFPLSFNRSVCIDPAKGCTAPARRSPAGSLERRVETLVQNPRPERQVRKEKYFREVGNGQGVKCPPSDAGCEPTVWYELEPAQGVLDGWTITRSGKDSFTNGFTTRLRQNITLWFGDGTSIPCATQYTCSQSVREYNGPRGTHYGNPNYPGLTESQQNAFKQVGHNSVFVRTIVPEYDINRWFVAAKHDGGNDYRAFGYWLNYDMVASDAEDPIWVVYPRFITRRLFTAGTDPVTDVSGVSGTATYRGEAAGMMMWHEGTGSHFQDGTTRRISTFDGAPVTLTADFDTMRLDGWVDLDGRYHEADGYVGAGSSLKHWETIGPEEIRIRHSVIREDGTFAGGAIVAVGDSIGSREEHSSHFQGRFYQPDGDHAPGSAMGTFSVQGADAIHNFYRVEGAFGTEKQ